MKELRRRVLRKLGGRKGETLAEVLIALLIAALALTMLASTIASSSKIILRSKDKMESYYDKNNEMAEMAESGTLTATIKISGSEVSLKGDDLLIDRLRRVCLLGQGLLRRQKIPAQLECGLLRQVGGQLRPVDQKRRVGGSLGGVIHVHGEKPVHTVAEDRQQDEIHT